MKKVITGLERIMDEPDLIKDAGKFGLLYNLASVDSRYRSAADLLHRLFPERLKALFGPQHGVSGTEQDNMKETAHGLHGIFRIPVFSLYSETRRPRPDMLRDLDTVLVDLQDVGTRVYTFAVTVLYMMQACAEAGKQLIILDRPNPVNGTDIEGNLVEPGFESFVGPYHVPMRHGLTMGELMGLYNEQYHIGCDLRIIEMIGWNRALYYESTGLPWVLPSPNMPIVETAVVYPGQVLLEGTNISEGRGTTRPFEIFGAPYFDPGRIMKIMEPECIQGAVLRETEFKPTFNKWSGRICRGFQVHVTDRSAFKPLKFTLGLLAAVLDLHPGQFKWSDPPYEYVEDKLPIDVILGTSTIRKTLEQGGSAGEIANTWTDELMQFDSMRRHFFLYD